jgi:hypothetical protein
VPIVLISGSLNLLETSGPFQDCNGMDLSFNLYLSDIESFIERAYIRKKP